MRVCLYNSDLCGRKELSYEEEKSNAWGSVRYGGRAHPVGIALMVILKACQLVLQLTPPKTAMYIDVLTYMYVYIPIITMV